MNDLLANMWLDAAVPFKHGLLFISIAALAFVALCSVVLVILADKLSGLSMTRNEKITLAVIIWILASASGIYDSCQDRIADRDERLKNDPVIQESWNEYKAAVQNLNDVLERARQHAEEVKTSGDKNGYETHN